MTAVVEAGGTIVLTTASSTSVTLAKPTGVVAGDLLIAFIAYDSTSATPTMPSGFELIIDLSNTTVHGFFMAKVATASEPADYTFTGSNRLSVASLHRVTGADTSGTATAAFDATGSLAQINNGQADTPSITTTVDNELVLTFYTKDQIASTADTDDTGNPAGTAIVYRRDSTSNTAGMATFTQATAGATGTKTWTDDGFVRLVGFQVAIKSAAGGGATKLVVGSLEAAVAMAHARVAGIEGAVQARRVASMDLHGALADVREAQALIEGALGRGLVVHAEADSALSAARKIMAGLNGAIAFLSRRETMMDASLTGAAGAAVVAALTAALSRLKASISRVDGALGMERTREIALHAIASRLAILTLGLNAAARAQRQSVATIDAVVGRAFMPAPARTFQVPGRANHIVPSDSRTYVIPPANRRH